MQELVEHPFWKAKLPVLPLPSEPALEAFIKQHKLAPAHGDDIAASQVSHLAAARSQVDSHNGRAFATLAAPSCLQPVSATPLQPPLPTAVTPRPQRAGFVELIELLTAAG